MKSDFNKDEIKFIPISQKDLILSLDRLTRFKYPQTKYYRVFSEILCKYLIHPKLSKDEIFSLNIDTLKFLCEFVWNESAQRLSPNVYRNPLLNKILFDETINTYNLSDDIKEFVNLDININAVLSLITQCNGLPINLKRLLIIENNLNSLKEKREMYKLRFPVEKVLLCEGITEEILMPKFASLAGYDFDANGVKLISAGGKNQVEKLYCELKDELKIPVFILLDADAAQTASNINSVLRMTDSIYLIKHGEFEDIFSLNLIKRTINKRFKNICECCIDDLKKDLPMTKTLSEFYRINNLGDFQKADFAKELAKNLKYKTDLTDEIFEIIKNLKKL